MAIDILTHNDGIRHFWFEGEPVETARGLLVLVACALQYIRESGAANPNTDPSTIEDLADIFLFSEIHKRTLQTKFCSVFYETVSDKDTLLSSGGLILPFEGMTLFLNFSPTKDDAIRTSLPEEIRLALRSHKALFYKGGLFLSVTSSVAAPPTFISQIALLTLLPASKPLGTIIPTPVPRVHITTTTTDSC